jgi:arylsulfatase A-like enzyme
MSGQYQQRFGGLECAIGLGDVGRYDEAIWLQKRGELGLLPSAITMPRIMKSGGYDTAIVGKWHLGYLPKFSPNLHGFDEFYGILGGNADYFQHTEGTDLPCFYHNDKPIAQEGYMTDLLTGHAVEWLKQRSQKPFLLYLPYTCPHIPLQGPDDAGKPLDNKSYERYRKMIERMDWELARSSPGGSHGRGRENTLVVFTSDNGAIPVGLHAFSRIQKLGVGRWHTHALPGAASGCDPAWEHNDSGGTRHGLAAYDSLRYWGPGSDGQEDGWSESAAKSSSRRKGRSPARSSGDTQAARRGEKRSGPATGNTSGTRGKMSSTIWPTIQGESDRPAAPAPGDRRRLEEEARRLGGE